MTTRTFIQQGRGYGPEPVSIVAKIDGVIVYEGEVDTLNEPLPILPGPVADVAVNIFSWTGDLLYTGSRVLEITVNNGTLFLEDSLANYTPKLNPNPPPPAFSSGPDEYLCFYNEDIDGDIISDPFVDPKVDGNEIARDRKLDAENPLTGQWCYLIGAGSVFTTTVMINSGFE